jgi:hypothetical protein
VRYSKKDINQKPLEKELKKRGILYWDVSQKNIGCDLLVSFITEREKIYFVEIKNGYTKSQQKLTDNEANLKDWCKSAGIPYLIVVDYEDFRRQIC